MYIEHIFLNFKQDYHMDSYGYISSEIKTLYFKL